MYACMYVCIGKEILEAGHPGGGESGKGKGEGKGKVLIAGKLEMEVRCSDLLYRTVYRKLFIYSSVVLFFFLFFFFFGRGG